MKKLALLALVVCLSSAATDLSAQIYRTSDQYIQNVKVTYGGRDLPSAWAGGLNNPQFALADIDHDGKEDLIILERYKGLKTFKNIGGQGQAQYIYSPNLEYLFPNVRLYIKMMDYNGDGITDLMHRGDGGFEVCDGYYNNSNLLTFKNCREIKYKHGQTPGLVSVYVAQSDMPAVVDVDGDGDVDIVAYGSDNEDLITFYRNLCKEESLPAETFKIKVQSECWGKTAAKYSQNRTHELGINCLLQGFNKTTKTTGAGAHALTLLHMNADGDYDMLDANEAYSEIQMLTNGRADINYKVDSMIAQDTMWAPNGVKIVMPKLPVAFWLDMDKDGDSDLVVSPQKNGTEDLKCVAYYRNDGAPGAPSFNYQNDSFLVNEMLDLGSDSRPAVYDYDKDGKKDLIVGSVKYNSVTGGTIAQLTLLRNTTTGGKLSFDLVTKGLLNMNMSGFDGVAPAIGDLDNDGVDDLVIGKRDGTLAFYKNNAPNNNVQPVWQQTIQQMTTKSGPVIQLSGYATPCFYDVDKDGKKDLVVGHTRGYLSYFHNEGTVPHEIKLVEETHVLGEVHANDLYQTYSAPFVGRIDNIQQDYLLVGNNDGIIKKFSGIEKGYNYNAPYTLVDSPYSAIQIRGMYASPVIADMDGDTTMLEMFIGNSNGGLFAYQQIFKQSVDDLPVSAGNKLKIHPNPAQNEIQLGIAGNSNLPADATISIYNNAGQRMKGFDVTRNKNAVTINIANLPQGVYLCAMVANGKNYSSVFVKNN